MVALKSVSWFVQEQVFVLVSRQLKSPAAKTSAADTEIWNWLLQTPDSCCTDWYTVPVKSFPDYLQKADMAKYTIITVHLWYDKQLTMKVIMSAVLLDKAQ